jgi:chromate transporter
VRGDLRLTTAFSANHCHHVGLVLNLAVWFAAHVFPSAKPADGFAIALSAVAFVGMLRWKWDIIPVVLGCGAIGLVYKLALG